MRGRLTFPAWSLAAALLALAPAGCRKPAPPVVPEIPATPQPTPRATPLPTPTPPLPATPPPEPTPPPPPYVPDKKLEIGKIFNGILYHVTLETERGGTATSEREDPSSYVAELTLKVKVPKPHRSLEDLRKLNDQLPTLLPALPAMLEKANISTSFEDLYRRKCGQLRSAINRLDSVLSRHNFFDCETILELQHPQTKRRALLIQADMDTDTDGSDADRVPDVDAASATFQPMTSYRWPKKGTALNGFVPPLEARIKQYEAELALPDTSAARKVALKSARDDARVRIADLKANSYLVAKLDPFIVLPTPMFGKGGAFAPQIGDYCVVIHGGKLLPAIIGDAGPTTKMGEASLRICKEIEPKASGEQRAENNLKVTYLVFPGSREKPFGPPDLTKWRTQCEALLTEFGGYGGELTRWEPPPKPAPAPPTPPSTTAPTLPTPAAPGASTAAPASKVAPTP